MQLNPIHTISDKNVAQGV